MQREFANELPSKHIQREFANAKLSCKSYPRDNKRIIL